MNKTFGIQGWIRNFPFKDLAETFYDKDGIEIEVREGVMYVGVDDENKLTDAEELACLYLLSWSERQNLKVEVSFNHSWKSNPYGGKDINVELHDEIKI